MNIILLTHERELDRQTNTGILALKLFPSICQRIIWSRVSPDEQLMELLQDPTCMLLFPSTETEDTQLVIEVLEDGSLVDTNLVLPSTLVILDATWQEARKMYRRSDYLKHAKKCMLITKQDSVFNLRRNQVEGGLCTAECIATLFQVAGHSDQAKELTHALQSILK